MTEVNVLVVFYSRYGAAERLGLAAGVGALQCRANIRLRRLADASDDATNEADPDRQRHLARMRRDYVEPRPADPVWADVIVLVAPADSSGQVERYVASLGGDGSMEGKIAAPLAANRARATLASIRDAASAARFTIAAASEDSGDAIADAKAFGQRVTEMARALKSGEPDVDQ